MLVNFQEKFVNNVVKVIKICKQQLLFILSYSRETELSSGKTRYFFNGSLAELSCRIVNIETESNG